jgi:integrase
VAEGVSIIENRDGTRSYRAFVYDRREGKKIRKTFPTHAAAKAWRTDTLAAVRAGRMRAAQAPRFEDLFGREVDGRWRDGSWLDSAYAGVIRTRGRRPFKESTIRSVRQHYQRRLERPFGRRRLDEVRLPDFQEFVDSLEMEGLSPSTIEGTILPLRLAYRWARSKGIIAVDPTDGIELPEKPRGTRVPPSPAGAAALLAAVPDEDRAMWAAAMLAGLRRGELLALRWEDVDLDAGILSVTRSFNPDGGIFSAPKSRYGVRKVPIGASFAKHLRTQALITGRRSGLVFGSSPTWPSRPESIQTRADTAWSNANAVAAALAAGEGSEPSAPLERVTLHACRHLYASMSIAAGVNAHALCKYMGHSGIQVTFDLYGHLFPGNEAQASALLDAYLESAFVAR